MKGLQGLYKSLPRRKSIVVVHLMGLNNFYTLFEYFYGRFTKSRYGIVHYGIGSISMPVASHIYNAANHVIVKNNCQSYFKKSEVLFSRKQHGAIMVDWKIYPFIFYHFSINSFLITIFQVAISLSIFSTTRTFLAQCRKQVNLIMYWPMLIETKLTIGFGNHA